MIFSPAITEPVRQIGARSFDFHRQIAVMAIINRTPDSFYDQGRTFALDKAVEAALTAAQNGADWVDIGGVRFAPGPEVPLADELDRVVPVVQAVSSANDVVISVDTFRPQVAHAAILAGAAVINDTTGIHDPAMAEVVADSNATLVITHSLAEPRTVFAQPHYDDVVDEVKSFLEQRVALALSYGIPENRIVIDPGHDLNKNTRHSLELTRRLDELTTLGLPILAATSRKDFIGESLGREREDRLAGSLAAACTCALAGARIVRVHDVLESVDAMRMIEAVLGTRDPAYERHNMSEKNTP